MAKKIYPGETLSGIAAQNNTTVDEIMKLNPNITNPNVIRAGDYINLPGETQTSASTTANSSLSNTTTGTGSQTQQSQTAVKSPIGGVSDQLYADLGTKLQDSSSYQGAMESINKAVEALNNSTYRDRLGEIADQLMNRSSFSYDFTQDPMFMNMLASYQNKGNMAMQDAIAQSSALTGGYANSWAQTAGQQAYNQHLQEAYSNLPAYYQLALDQYNQESSDLERKYALLSNLDETEYSRNKDQYGFALDSLNQAVNEYNSNMTNNQYLAQLGNSEYWTKTQFDYQKQQDAIANANAAAALKQQQDEFAYKQWQDSQEEPLDRYIRVGEARLGEDGKTYITYQRQNSGQKIEVVAGQNPYNGYVNEDVDSGTFDTYGYQPDNIGGEPLRLAKDENGNGRTYTINGHEVKVFYTGDDENKRYWAWDGTKNRYVELEEE